MKQRTWFGMSWSVGEVAVYAVMTMAWFMFYRGVLNLTRESDSVWEVFGVLGALMLLGVVCFFTLNTVGYLAGIRLIEWNRQRKLKKAQREHSSHLRDIEEASSMSPRLAGRYYRAKDDIMTYRNIHGGDARQLIMRDSTLVSVNLPDSSHVLYAEEGAQLESLSEVVYCICVDTVNSPIYCVYADNLEMQSQLSYPVKAQVGSLVLVFPDGDDSFMGTVSGVEEDHSAWVFDPNTRLSTAVDSEDYLWVDPVEYLKNFAPKTYHITRKWLTYCELQELCVAHHHLIKENQFDDVDRCSLRASFVWGMSPQGHFYWKEISERISND